MRIHRFYILVVLLIMSCTFELSAQVGINNSNLKVSGSAMLDISSADKGLLIPRISTESRDQIPSPATGLLIYNTTTNHFNYFNGSFWYQVETSFVSDKAGTNSPGGGVSISTTVNRIPDNSAMLDASDPTRGFLLPRITTTGSIPAPDNGLIIYDLSDNLLKYYIDNEWHPVCAVPTPATGATGSQAAEGVSINTTGAGPHFSAILDVTSPDKGVLIPRLTSGERDMVLPVTGLTIFNTSAKEIEYYNGSNWFRMNVISPAGVTIAANTTTVCAGTQVNFTATPANGGETPTYKWKVNGSFMPGATNAAYAYAPANNDAVSCEMISSSPCAIGNPAISTPVTITVNPLLPLSVSITPSANPVCAGTLVTFSTSAIGGELSPAYQWLVNGSHISGATNAAYTYAPVNNDAVYCIVTSSAFCATGSPDTSNVVTMTVNPLLPVSILVTPSANPVCAGTPVTFSSAIVNGGAEPLYQWKLNGADIPGATNTTYTYTPANNNAIKCILSSNATCATGNPAASNVVTMNVNPLLPVSISVTPSANPVCDGTSVTFNTSVVNGGAAPTYQWKLNGTDVPGATNATYTFTPANNNTIACALTSNATCATGSPAASNVVTMTVNPLLPVSILVAPSANPVCAGTSVTFSTSVVNGGAAPAYQWKLNGNDVAGATNATYTYTPEDNHTLTCILASNATCATGTPAASNTITMTVHPLLPVSISATASANPVCAETPVTFSTSVVNGGAAPTYQWKLNGTDVPGATNPTYTFVPANNNALACVLTSNATCATGNPAASNMVNMTVNPLLPVSIQVTPSANPVCAGTSVTFGTAIVNGGGAPTYQWKLNGTEITGATNTTYTYTPANGNALTCVLTSNATCATGSPAASNVVNMTVNPLLPVSILVTPSANPVCAGTPVTFSSAIVNGGSAPTYQWKLNGNNITGATNANYTFAPANTNALSCVVTSNGTCATGSPATSNVVTMTVNPLVPVSVSIFASVYAVMPGTPVTFTANTPVNGGTSPTYQWKVNTANAAGATNTTFTYTPADKDKVTCVVTSNSTVGCLSNNPATSNPVYMIVYMTGTPCAGIPTVSYGGLTYNTVQIGTQCWLRENLNIGSMISNSDAQTNNGITEKYCYNNLQSNCDVYGGLYQWNELMQYVTTSGAQGICPADWHVPTDTEFTTLSTFLGGSAGGAMKETGLNHFFSPNVGANNTTGFTALPGGYSIIDPIGFGSLTRMGYFYTSTAYNTTDVWYYTVNYSASNVQRLQNYKTTSNSVRCLKN